VKDVILTTALNYDYETIKLFLNSLNTFYKGEVVIFSNEQYKPRYLNYKLTVIGTDSELVRNSNTLKLNSIINARHSWYLDFLNSFEYDRVLLTDSRDVFFQSDPFERINDNSLHVAVEDNTIGNCPFNSKWINSVYGIDYLNKISKEQVVCAGTTMGSYATITAYLKYMTSQLEKYGPLLDTGNNRDILIDQSIHNYFCIEYADKVTRFTNCDDLFLTLGYSKTFRLNREGSLINQDNKPYALIHQFDRIKWLTDHLEYQLKDLIKKNNRLHLSMKKSLKKNIRESVRYLIEKEK
jgi:hypothetical protein